MNLPGSLKMTTLAASGGLAKKCETVKRLSMLKVPASMAPNEPRWSPRSNGSLSDLTNGSRWLH